MTVDTKNLISISEANQNFSRVARMVDENGSVVILKNNVPRYLITDIRLAEQMEEVPHEDVMQLGKRLIEKNRKVFEALAK